MKSTPVQSIWSDEPLAACDVDEFGRRSFIETVVTRIRMARTDDPRTVFGLVGEWGAGKTSALARVRETLDDE